MSSKESEHFSCVVFDTETTGKIQYVEDESKKKTAIMPRVIQLGYIYYDTSEPSKTKIFDKLIDIDDSIEISDGATEIHHITKESIREASSTEKLTMEEALQQFLDDIEKCDYVVAHNLEFDKNVLLHELEQLENEELKTRGLALFNTFTEKNQWTCTMKDNIQVCKLQTVNQRNLDRYLKSKGEPPKNYYKFPQLSETYNHYFGYSPNEEALHKAIMDVVLCLRIFVRYISGKDICGTHGEITDLIREMSPKDYDFDKNCPMEENSEAIISKGGKSKKRRTKRRKTKRKTKRRRRTTMKKK
jgi:DNA polymerase III epsilon subunit-like protein